MSEKGQLDSDLLLLRFAPFKDELLTSWIVRLSNAHGSLLHTFCRLLWPEQTIWTRDIDSIPNPFVIQRLSCKTGVSEKQIYESTLMTYQNLFYKNITSGNKRWILSLGLYHRARHRRGLQFCPDCFKVDPRPYFRKQWRLACNTICSNHLSPLLDACSFCGNNISTHQLLWDQNGMPHCNKCSQSLANCKLPKWTVSESLKKIHLDFDLILKQGFVTRNGIKIPAVEFMYGLRIFVAALLFSNYEYKLFKFGVKNSGIDSLGIESNMRDIRIFENQNHRVRFVLMSIAAHFIYMPENMLVSILRNERIGGSCFFGTQYKNFPEWLMNIMNQINLNKH